VTSGGVAYYRQTEGQTSQPGYKLRLLPLQAGMQKHKALEMGSEKTTNIKVGTFYKLAQNIYNI